MSTIPQRLRNLAQSIEDDNLRAWPEMLRAIAAELEAPAADAAPVSDEFIRATCDAYIAWCATHYRPEALDESGMMSLHGLWAWQEQERRTRATVAALQAEIAQLQQSRDNYFAERNSARDAYMKHRKIGEELQARINALEARQVPESAKDVHAVVWPTGAMFTAGSLKQAQSYMDGAIPSCLERGEAPPVIVRYVPTETVPYDPQPDTSKEQP